MKVFWRLAVCVVVVVLSGSCLRAEGFGADFVEDFSSGGDGWGYLLDLDGEWFVGDGVLRAVRIGDSVRVAPVERVRDVVVEADVRARASAVRKCFGLVVRSQGDGSCLAMRYYDGTDSLQLLHYRGGRAYDAGRGDRGVGVAVDKWYRMKAAVVGDRFFGKMWLRGEDEPGWQLEVKVEEMRAGGVGVIAHDSGGIEFDGVRVWNDSEKVGGIMAAEEAVRLRRIGETLAMEVFVSPFVQQRKGRDFRRVDLVTLADGERFALGGRIEVCDGDLCRRYAVVKGDAVYGVYSVFVAELKGARELEVVFETELGKRLEAVVEIEAAEVLKWGDYARRCVDTLIEHGTDRYGAVHTPMLMSMLDVYTLDAPERPLMLDDEIRTEGRPDHGRRSPGGSNLWLDQPTIKAMYRLSERTGDRKYADAADAYIGYALKNCRKSTGMLYWGSHSYWNGYRERYGGDGEHEILIKHPDWANMYRVNPAAVRAEIDGIWKYHIQNKETGRHNRHDSPGTGDFAFSSGSFSMAFAFMYKATGEEHYLEKARLISDWHWSHRSELTGLVPESAWASEQEHVYWNGWHMFTQVTGCYGSQLLRCYEICGDTSFRDRAIAYMKAYERWGWDEEERNYYGMIRVRDGKRIVEFNADEGAHESPYTPIGYVNVWRTIMYTWEFPLVAAQAAVYAYEVSDVGGGEKDGELLKIARHWGEVIEKNLPAKQGRRFKDVVEAAMPEVKRTGGTYAENYGRAISFFVHLYRATGQRRYLELAEGLARAAVEKLYVNGLFKGHPAKPYYQANDGVGFLLYALLELERPEDELRGAF